MGTPYFDEYALYTTPFSIDRHKAAPYKISLEAIIAPDGTIEYAMPSHQEYLIAKAMQIHHWTRQQLMDACPPEYYFNFMEWLIQETGGYLPIWEPYTFDRPITVKQAAALRKLKLAGLFTGAIPPKIISAKEDNQNEL